MANFTSARGLWRETALLSEQPLVVFAASSEFMSSLGPDEYKRLAGCASPPLYLGTGLDVVASFPVQLHVGDRQRAPPTTGYVYRATINSATAAEVGDGGVAKPGVDDSVGAGTAAGSVDAGASADDVGAAKSRVDDGVSAGNAASGVNAVATTVGDDVGVLFTFPAGNKFPAMHACDSRVAPSQVPSTVKRLVYITDDKVAFPKRLSCGRVTVWSAFTPPSKQETTLKLHSFRHLKFFRSPKQLMKLLLCTMFGIGQCQLCMGCCCIIGVHSTLQEVERVHGLTPAAVEGDLRLWLLRNIHARRLPHTQSVVMSEADNAAMEQWICDCDERFFNDLRDQCDDACRSALSSTDCREVLCALANLPDHSFMSMHDTMALRTLGLVTGMVLSTSSVRVGTMGFFPPVVYTAFRLWRRMGCPLSKHCATR